MKLKKDLLNKILLACLLLLSIVFSIKSLREPDLWWQIRTGQWIIDNKQVPTQDIFSYTFYGTKWVNIKWGFEVIAAFVCNTFGAENVFIIQAIVSLLIIILLVKNIRLINIKIFGSSYSQSVTYIVSTAVLIGISYRIIGRPEMFSHLFVLVFFYILNKYKNTNHNRLYLLPVFQILWTNMHEAFGLGIVIAFIYLFSEWLCYFYYKKNKAAKPIKLTIVALLCMLATAVNPYGIEMMAKPFEIFYQLETNKFTSELFDYTQHQYWQKEAYTALVFLTMCMGSFLYILLDKNNIKNRVENFIDKVGLGNIILIIAFVFLASTAYRNVVFVLIISAVFVATFIQFIVLCFNKKVNIEPILSIAAIVFCIGLYGLVISDVFYKKTASNDRYGMAIAVNNNPEGAAIFLEKNKLQSSTIFTDYISSSYLLYRLQPKFKTFLDLRDLDIFPSYFFEKNTNAYLSYNSYKNLDSMYNFKAAVILNRQFNNLLVSMYNDSNYTLCFADPLVSVFIKQKNTTNNEIKFSSYTGITQTKLAYVINKIFNPFYKPFNNEAVDINQEAALYYMQIGNMPKAKALASKSIKLDNSNCTSLLILAQYFSNKSMQDTAQKTVYLDSAIQYYNAAIKQNKNYTEAYMGLGIIQFKLGNINAAIKLFELCIKQEPELLNAYLYASEGYKYLLEKNSDKKWVNALVNNLEIANTINPNNPDIEWNLGVAYYKQGKCEQATTLLQKVIMFEGLPYEDKNIAIQFINNCKGKN